MLKFITYLTLFSFSLLLCSTPVSAREATLGDKLSADSQPLQLYRGYFPYQECLLATIEQVGKKPHGVLLLTVKIEDVYSGNYKKDSRLTLSLYEGDEEQYKFLLALKSTRQIIAFSHWTKESERLDALLKASKIPIRSLWIPCARREVTSCDIAEIKSAIETSPREATQTKAAFQRLLESKWTPARINDFCRPETQLIYGEASEHCACDRKTDWFASPMHTDKTAELQGKIVEWQASADNGTPLSYNIKVISSKNGWDLEVGTPSAEVWNDDQFLMHRVGCSINQAALAHREANRQTLAGSGYFYNMILDRSKESLVKDKTGIVTDYRCRLSNGSILTATLTKDNMQAVSEILINGKRDKGWTAMYKECLNNMKRCLPNER